MYTYVLETKYQIKCHRLLLVTGLADVVASCNQSCIYFVHGPVADKFAGVRQHACFLFRLSHHFFSTPKRKWKQKQRLPHRWWHVLKWLQSKQELMCNPEGLHGSSEKGISCNGMKVALVHVSPCSCIFIISLANYLFFFSISFLEVLASLASTFTW